MSNELAVPICEALGIDPNLVARIVVELVTDKPARVYVQMSASEKTLDVEWCELSGAKITVLDQAPVKNLGVPSIYTNMVFNMFPTRCPKCGNDDQLKRTKNHRVYCDACGWIGRLLPGCGERETDGD